MFKRKIMKRIILAIILLSILLSPLFSSRMEEFYFLKTQIEKNHKNFYNTISKEECEKKFMSLSQDIDKLSYTDYYFTLMEYLALSHDSHTSLYSEDIYSHFKYFPLQLNYIGEKVYVVSETKEYGNIMGKEVVSINEIKIEEV